MIARILLSLVFVVGLMACSAEKQQAAKPEKNEFDVFCDQFAALVGSENYSALSQEERADQLDRMLVSNINPDGNAYIAWSAIRHATPSDRQLLYVEAARSTGYENWSCAAINSHGHQVGSAHD